MQPCVVIETPLCTKVNQKPIQPSLTMSSRNMSSEWEQWGSIRVLRIPISTHEISWCLYWEYMLSSAFINNDPIHRDIWPLIGQSLLLILAQAQYPIKVNSPCSKVAWWIMTVDNHASWFTIGLVQYASHTLVHSPLETQPNGQDKSSLQLGGGAL